jgi:hypothetical protein
VKLKREFQIHRIVSSSNARDQNFFYYYYFKVDVAFKITIELKFNSNSLQI